MVTPTGALPGREQRAFALPERHAVLGIPLEPPFPEGSRTAVFGLGCFWGGERKFWQIDGVYTTSRSATREASRRTRPTKRFVAVGPDTPRPCSSSSTPRRSPTGS